MGQVGPKNPNLVTGDYILKHYWKGGDMYKIVRHYFRGGKRVIKSGLTLEEAQRHCSDPETSSSTATKAQGKKRTAQRGPWFDGYTECNR